MWRMILPSFFHLDESIFIFRVVRKRLNCYPIIDRIPVLIWGYTICICPSLNSTPNNRDLEIITLGLCLSPAVSTRDPIIKPGALARGLIMVEG